MCALNFPHDLKGSPLTPVHAGVFCGEEGEEHDGEKNHTPWWRSIVFKNLLLGKVAGEGVYSLWVFHTSAHGKRPHPCAYIGSSSNSSEGASVFCPEGVGKRVVMVGANRRCGTLGHVNRVVCGWWLPCGTLTIRKSDTSKNPKKSKKGNEEPL